MGYSIPMLNIYSDAQINEVKKLAEMFQPHTTKFMWDYNVCFVISSRCGKFFKDVTELMREYIKIDEYKIINIQDAKEHNFVIIQSEILDKNKKRIITLEISFHY